MTVGTCSFLGQLWHNSSEDVSMCLPADPKNAEPSPPSRLPYPCSYAALTPQTHGPSIACNLTLSLVPFDVPFDSLVIAP